MTNKMAMRYLSPVKTLMKKLDFDCHYIEALELAIKALEFMDNHSDMILNEDESEFLLNYLKDAENETEVN